MSNCSYCGNNPVSHRLTWFNESMAVVLMPLNQLVFNRLVVKKFVGVISKLFAPLFYVLEITNFITYRDEPSEKTSARAKVLWDEAKARGIRLQSVVVLGRENDAFRAIINGKTIYFSGLPRPEYAPTTAEWWMDDKGLVKQKLLRAGIPVAQGGVFSRYEPLKRMFDQLEKPVIIKPRLGSRGRHTTTFIYNEEQLQEAFRIAKQLCFWVVMEEHLVGSVYRATMINHRLTGILRGDPPRVTGDGNHTIAELIFLKNQTKHPEIHEVNTTPAMEIFLSRSNYTLQSVLPLDTTIDLSEKIGVSYGGNSAEDTLITHDETKRILEQAAQAIGDPILGFDFIIKNINQSPHEQKWGIIECNGVPFINLHYDPIEGPPNQVGKYVWEFVENHLDYY